MMSEVAQTRRRAGLDAEAVRVARAALREGLPGPIHEIAAALPPIPALAEALAR